MKVVGSKVYEGETVVREFSSNEAAWRWLDKQSNEHLSPRERSRDWNILKFLKS